MKWFIDRRLARLALNGIAAIILAGCVKGAYGPQGGADGPFSVVSASPERAVLSAHGRQVAVEPMEGFCVTEDSIKTSARSAFVLIGGCALDDKADREPDANGQLDLPPSMPGITTVSISGSPGFGRDGVSAGDLSELARYLETDEGRELIGRGSGNSHVSVIRTERREDALYMLVEDKSKQAVPLLAPRFWRAFVVLNDRLTVVTVSGFREAPMSEDEMLRYLDNQVRQLQMANANPVNETPTRLVAATSEKEVRAEPTVAASAGQDDDNFAGTGDSAVEEARAAARARHAKAERARAARRRSPMSSSPVSAGAPENQESGGSVAETETPTASAEVAPPPARPTGALDPAAREGVTDDGAAPPRPAPRAAGNGAPDVPMPPERGPS